MNLKNINAFIKILLTFLFFNLFFVSSSNAKRLAPKEVNPVISNGIKYIVPHFKIINGKVKHGYIEAWDINLNKKIWEIQIYKINYDNNLEKDVQDVFIISLKIQKNKLIILNEINDKYELNIETKKINKL